MTFRTIRNVVVFSFLLLSLSFAHDADANTLETAHYDVVSEYIRSLGAVYHIQRAAEADFRNDENTDNPSVSKIMSAIRSSTRMKLELNYSIAVLRQMKLKEPFETLIPSTISFYWEKIELHDELVRIASRFVNEVPKPGVDYSKVIARMPEITASMEYIDQSIFKSMVLVFALLIDEKPDSEGHMSHLSITTAQRQKLIDDVDMMFGASLDKGKKNWTVSSAALLKTYLLKDYKCKDEWQNEEKALRETH